MSRAAEIRDDPVALRAPRLCRFFTGVMERQMRRGFRAVRMLRPGLPDVSADAPLVVYSNHPGWWDPAFYIVLQGRVLRREGFGPMEADALERYGFMKRIGIFGVDPGSRAGAARFLRVGAHVLSDPRRCLWMTAQGRFADPRERPVELRPGLAHLMARVPGAVALPLALEYPFWSEKRPEALCHFGPPIARAADADAWQAALTEGLEAAQDRLAAAAMARDPAAFETVLGGRRGVGGLYGAWSRLRAATRGKSHDPDHLPDPPPASQR
ncbi:lysophospholipid acyltransferase family protein [Jannaschia formosa]|uniref:lysophospholipid acyltransferase family protein n=1 Tax=Jannaschia formosa TaxID=2259592 RepID=UPI000E1B9879|nr:lysophospholipid acyltransferase family protein [Jannaschia formosa]TFL16298.1 acyltransferase [Jannaschia formosa]